MENFTREAIWPRTLFAGRFFFFIITNLVLLVVIGLFKSSVSSWFSFEKLYVSGNLSISSWLSNCWHIVVCNSFLEFFVFLWCSHSFFICDYIYLGLLSFSFVFFVVQVLQDSTCFYLFPYSVFGSYIILLLLLSSGQTSP